MDKLPVDTLVEVDWHRNGTVEDPAPLKVGKAPRNCPAELLAAEERGEMYWLIFAEPMDDWGDGREYVSDVPAGWHHRDIVIPIDNDIVSGFEGLLATYGVD